MKNSSNEGYWREYKLRRELMDMWNNVMDKYSVNGNEDEIRRYSIFAESCAAYRALRLVKGIDKRVYQLFEKYCPNNRTKDEREVDNSDKQMDQFIKKYCSNTEMRHECRTRLGSLLSPNLDEDKLRKFNKYKSLTFLFSRSRDMMRSKRERNYEARNKMHSKIEEERNEGFHNFKSALYELCNELIHDATLPIS